MADHDEAPKSALEIAMARLRQQDAASGGTAVPPLSDDQKARIADIRQTAQARLAQEDILFKAALASTWDPAARAELEENHRRDVQRITDERDGKIDKVRRG